jgi:hypothetical protein
LTFPSKPFFNPLAVAVTSVNPIEPVDGGIVGFAAPAAGASAALSAATASIAGGQAGITATANGTMGSYVVTATAAGAASASFALSNTESLSLKLTTHRDVMDEFDGLTSLREAIAYANAHPGPDTITFDPAVFGKSPRTIKLNGGPLVLTDEATTTIVGPGARLLTLSGGQKSRVFDVEGGSLALNGMTISGGRADRGGGILNDRGALALDHVVLRRNRAGVGGGLFNDGTAALSDVAIWANMARVGSGLFNTRRATLAWRGLSRRAFTSTILNQTFSGSGFPSNWQQFLPGTVVQTPTSFLTITDSTGNHAGILSTLKTVPFKPLGVTTITAQISGISVSPHLGNAIFGLLGPNGTAMPGNLAAGIDGQGNVFIVEYDPAQKIAQPNVVRVGVIQGYAGSSPVTLNFTINSGGVQISAVTSAGTTKFREFTFAKDLHNFSMKTAFPNGAIPALVAASQPKDKGGSANFESISVSTAS